MIFQWLLTILISLNLAVSSVPRCGMLRHVVNAFLDSHGHSEVILSDSSCHGEVHEAQDEQAEEKDVTAISDDHFCPCHLAKFSYIWVIFDFSPQLLSELPSVYMEKAWSRLLGALATVLAADTPPPR